MLTLPIDKLRHALRKSGSRTPLELYVAMLDCSTFENVENYRYNVGNNLRAVVPRLDYLYIFIVGFWHKWFLTFFSLSEATQLKEIYVRLEEGNDSNLRFTFRNISRLPALQSLNILGSSSLIDGLTGGLATMQHILVPQLITICSDSWFSRLRKINLQCLFSDADFLKLMCKLSLGEDMREITLHYPDSDLAGNQDSYNRYQDIIPIYYQEIEIVFKNLLSFSFDHPRPKYHLFRKLTMPSLRVLRISVNGQSNLQFGAIPIYSDIRPLQWALNCFKFPCLRILSISDRHLLGQTDALFRDRMILNLPVFDLRTKVISPGLKYDLQGMVPRRHLRFKLKNVVTVDNRLEELIQVGWGHLSQCADVIQEFSANSIKLPSESFCQSTRPWESNKYRRCHCTEWYHYEHRPDFEMD